MAKKSFVDRCVKDEEGNIVLGQKPNLPIIVWLASLVIGSFTEGRLYTVIDLVGFGALFTWAWLELFDGVNYFRRIIGLLVLIGMIYGRIY